LEAQNGQIWTLLDLIDMELSTAQLGGYLKPVC
jgi:hypothetical protein